MVANAWEDIPALTFKRSWNKLLKFGDKDKDGSATDTCTVATSQIVWERGCYC